MMVLKPALKLALVLAALLTVSLADISDQEFDALQQRVQDFQEKLSIIEDGLQKSVESLSRQLSLQQLYVEEQARSNGDSGVKVVRLSKTGTRSYYSDSYTNGNRVMSIHEHADFRDTVGMGEFSAVLNGVEFRTRHNDYRLVMPHKVNKEFGATQDIPKPAVPPQVLNKATIAEQAAEMREWFKAWQNQNHRQRDYRQYFKPVLCYLEGMWTNTDLNTIDEPFASDRHSIDAASFFALQDSIKFTTSTGRKSQKENYAFLPTTVVSVKDGVPQMAQWNYNILCHPIKQQVPLNRFRLEDDLANRLARGKPEVDIKMDRNARFSLWHPLLKKGARHELTKKEGYDNEREGTFLDSLMAEIPGKDNYPARIQDDVWDEVAYPYDSSVTYATRNASRPLNAGYYHRSYKSVGNDAMGSNFRRRGFNDANLYVALTSNEKILGHTTSKCERDRSCTYRNARRNLCNLNICRYWTQRVSYAIPLEIIYMTPLMSWNPYNFVYHDGDNSENPQKLNLKNGIQRNGGFTKDLAYNGNSRKKYYTTPANFYTGAMEREDRADTSFSTVGVLDPRGTVRRVMASGVNILTPEIEGVGRARIRYPIMPIYDQGNTIKKQLDALNQIVMYPQRYQQFYPRARNTNGTTDEVFSFTMPRATRDPPGPHEHTIELTASQLRALKYDNSRVTVVSDTSSGHDHELLLKYGEPNPNPHNRWFIQLVKCDAGDNWAGCWDGHIGALYCLDCVGSDYPV